MKKIVKVLASIAGLITVFAVYIQLSYKQKFEAPLTGLHASSDSVWIKRGKYLALGPAHCYACHTSDSLRRLNLREPLIGGKQYKTPFATINVPNITSDAETGIGNLSDEDIARAIRYNVSHTGTAMPGFMSFNDMSDADIKAILSYLRSVTPVRHKVPPHDLNIIGKTLMRFVIKPKLDVNTNNISPDTTAAYGKYLSNSVAQCSGCHTKRNNIGEFTGRPFAGGQIFEEEDGRYISANLTPDDSTGRIAKWNEEVFIQRFRAGRALEHSPMPWEGYQSMSTNDLKAIYRYLRSLPPVRSEQIVTYIPKTAELQAER